MSTVFHIKYKGGWLHLHEGQRKVSKVAAPRHSTPFVAEADAWQAIRKLRLDIDFAEVVNSQKAESTNPESRLSLHPNL